MTAGEVLKGIEFSRPGGVPLLLDLYLPAGADADAPADAGALVPVPGPVPAIVHFHGGGWRMGERSSLGPVTDGFALAPFERVASAGFAVVSADYRLSSQAVFPAQLQDAQAAVAWLRAHAAEYNVDPDRIYAWGDSAGGHLACLVGLGADPDSGSAGSGVPAANASVAAVAAWYPPTDLVHMGEQALPNAVATADDPGSREALLIGAQPADAPEKAAAASPLTYAGDHAPPFFLAHGTADRFVPAAQSATLAAALEAAGADVELLLIEGADHMWSLPDNSPAAVQTVLDATIDFFRRQAQAS
ncbi:alpha/beta hydrolase fold domain-containing protein [Arthrobacter sp. HS15c]|uniref:alpha/beta hydrolase fold domain-containing protein n=1 Tax=Arthrobacter sp. HS15c TaxID=3230279 RepID=UPI003467DE58